MGSKTTLQKQLDHQKFLTTVDYVRKAAAGPKSLTAGELARLNLLLIGKPIDGDFEPWRIGRATVRIPTGQEHQFNVISNPISRARDLIGHAWQLTGNGKGLEAAFFLYSQLVLNHLFESANRRTGVAAALWVLLSCELDCDATALLALPPGDLRQNSDLLLLHKQMESLVQPRR